MGYIWVKVPSLKPDREHWKIHGNDTRNQLAAGIPMAFQFAITASGTMIMQSAINLFGSVAVAAYTAAAKLQSLVIQGMIAMGQTMATYGGQNYGSGDVKRIKSGVRSALLAEFVYSVAAAALMCALLKPCLGLFFTGDVDLGAMMPVGKNIQLHDGGLFPAALHDLYFPQHYAGLRLRISSDDGRCVGTDRETAGLNGGDPASELSAGVLRRSGGMDRSSFIYRNFLFICYKEDRKRTFVTATVLKKLRRLDPDAPKTGDETHRNFWFLMMGISAAGILFMTRKKEQE